MRTYRSKLTGKMTKYVALYVNLEKLQNIEDNNIVI